MILQRDLRFSDDPELTPYGCHFMAELFLLNRVANIELAVEVILKALNELRRRRASYQPEPGEQLTVIGPQVTINNPDDIALYFGVKYKHTARMEDANYVCVTGEQELLQWTRPREGDTTGENPWIHWVAGDGLGHVAYDPEGYSVTVAHGTMIAKKIFTFYV